MVKRELTDKAKADLLLIERALGNGDQRAYSELMSKYRDPIYFMLYEKVKDADLAKELTIEALGKAFNKLRLYTPNYAFSTWLFTIARNNAIDYLRKKKVNTTSIDELRQNDNGDEIVFDLPDGGLNPENYLLKKQRLEIVRNIVNQLDPKYKKLVRLRYFKEFSYDEIADELDLPVGTVKAQLFRSRQQLFKLLQGKNNLF
ncbi:MAG: RNA polymerase sigma factor [Flavobacteriales bacterium]